VPISDAEEERESRSVRHDEDRLLRALLDNPDRPLADLARACGFTLASGGPHKSKVVRRLEELRGDKMVRRARERWQLTELGHKAAEKLRKAATDETIEVRGGAQGSLLEFTAIKGKKLPDSVPCIHCQIPGNVYKIKDGRPPKGKRHAESPHETCAKAWFEGKF
jgi:hypothetical protein